MGTKISPALDCSLQLPLTDSVLTQDHEERVVDPAVHFRFPFSFGLSFVIPLTLTPTRSFHGPALRRLRSAPLLAINAM